MVYTIEELSRELTKLAPIPTHEFLQCAREKRGVFYNLMLLYYYAKIER